MNRKQNTKINEATGDLNSLEILEWDSSFFGYKVGKSTAREISPFLMNNLVEQAGRQGVRLLYVFMNANDYVSQGSAHAVGGKLVDNKVTFNLQIKDREFGNDGHIGEFMHDYPSDKLIQLALQSGLYSRYKIDRNFKKNEFEKLYTEWIVNSVNKKLADYTLVYRDRGEELGFVTLKLNDKYGQIGLIAVDKSHRGKSIGKKLIFAGINLVKSKGIKNLQVPTQKSNTGACRFYLNIGFEEIETESIYHIWL